MSPSAGAGRQAAARSAEATGAWTLRVGLFLFCAFPLYWMLASSLKSSPELLAYPPTLVPHLTVFALAIVIGYYVIGHVHHALHTPLMSVTNAISGIIVVGGLIQIGHGDDLITAVSTVAILLASINIFGGFAVTERMLDMFKKKKK